MHVTPESSTAFSRASVEPDARHARIVHSLLEGVGRVGLGPVRARVPAAEAGVGNGRWLRRQRSGRRRSHRRRWQRRRRRRRGWLQGRPRGRPRGRGRARRGAGGRGEAVATVATVPRFSIDGPGGDGGANVELAAPAARGRAPSPVVSCGQRCRRGVANVRACGRRLAPLRTLLHRVEAGYGNIPRCFSVGVPAVADAQIEGAGGHGRGGRRSWRLRGRQGRQGRWRRRRLWRGRLEGDGEAHSLEAPAVWIPTALQIVPQAVALVANPAWRRPIGALPAVAVQVDHLERAAGAEQQRVRGGVRCAPPNGGAAVVARQLPFHLARV